MTGPELISLYPHIDQIRSSSYGVFFTALKWWMKSFSHATSIYGSMRVLQFVLLTLLEATAFPSTLTASIKQATHLLRSQESFSTL